MTWIISNIKTLLYALGVCSVMSLASFLYGFHVRGDMADANTAKLVIQKSKAKDEIRNRPKSDAITANRLSKGTF